MITPDEQDIEHVASEAAAIVADGDDGAWPSMTYEQGVRDALAWIVGDADDHPLADHPAFRAQD